MKFRSVWNIEIFQILECPELWSFELWNIEMKKKFAISEIFWNIKILDILKTEVCNL